MHAPAALFGLIASGAAALSIAQRDYSVPNYNCTSTGQATINAPTDCGSYITYIAHPANNYDPSLCAADCDKQRAEQNPYNGLRCHFFTSYQLLKNNVVQNQICALYSRTWDASYATNTGYHSGNDTYSVQNAYSFSYSDPGTFMCPQGNPTPAPGPGPVPAPAPAPPTSPLTTCPTTPSYIVAGSRILYRICLDTDYQISSPQIASQISDNRACGNLCTGQQGCTKAVYNPSYQTCWLKGSPSTADANWQKNPGFQTIDRVPANTPVTQCLAPLYYIAQGGVTYAVCPSSHTNSAAVLNAWTSVWDEYQCAQLCNTAGNCKKTVFDWTNYVCYNIGNANLAQSGWATYDNLNTYWAV